MNKRKSGILLHISSLPGRYGIGTFGKSAYNFVDFLKRSNQRIWQVLPIGHTGFGNSPYSSYSAFAGNPLFIDLKKLAKTYNINLSDILSNFDKLIFDNKKVEYDKVKEFKIPILEKIALFFSEKEEFEKKNYNFFKKENKFWLDDYAFFISLKKYYNEKPLSKFAKNIRTREYFSLQKIKSEISNEIELNKIIQYFFFEQWFELKAYANKNSVEIIGDIPLYVAEDSADVWSNPEIFMLDKDLIPKKVAGVPPDYFSETGQLWGNPLYDWQKLKETGYNWWLERLRMNFKLFDIARIDHFRGLSEFWAVKNGSENAIHGEWLKANGDDFLNTALAKLSNIKLIAEDLGIITPDVEKLRDKYNFPGMKVLQFAFESGEQNNFLPHFYNQNFVVYTGTHDNDTTAGWYKNLNEKGKNFMHKYLIQNDLPVSHLLIKIAWLSVANISIFPLQDLFELKSDCRMNLPGTVGDNWQWRFTEDEIKNEHIDFLKEITQIYGRNI